MAPRAGTRTAPGRRAAPRGAPAAAGRGCGSAARPASPRRSPAGARWTRAGCWAGVRSASGSRPRVGVAGRCGAPGGSRSARRRNAAGRGRTGRRPSRRRARPRRGPPPAGARGGLRWAGGRARLLGTGRRPRSSPGGNGGGRDFVRRVTAWRRSSTSSDGTTAGHASRGRVVPVALAGVLVLAAVAALLAWQQYQDARSSALRTVRARTVLAATVFDTYFAGEIAQMNAIADAPAVVGGDRPAMAAYFKRVVRSNPQAFTGGLGWIDAHGMTQVSSIASP